MKRPSISLGFTLIELLVVIAIIALLVSILVPALSSAKKLAQRAICQTHLKSIGYAGNMYIQDNNDWVPPNRIGMPYVASGWAVSWDNLIMKYVESGLQIPDKPTPAGPVYGAWYFVGNRGYLADKGAEAWYNPGYKITYSKMLGCPSQPLKYPNPYGTGTPSPYMHYVKSRTYQLDYSSESGPYSVTMIWPPGGVPNTGNRSFDYKNASQFALFGEPEVWNDSGTSHSPYWQTSNSRNIIIDMAGKAVHIGHTNNFCSLAGSVFMMTDTQMVALTPVKTVKQYPFYAR